MEQSLLAGIDFVPCGLAATQQRAPVLTNFANHVQLLASLCLTSLTRAERNYTPSQENEYIRCIVSPMHIEACHYVSVVKNKQKNHHLKKSLLLWYNEHAIVSNYKDAQLVELPNSQLGHTKPHPEHK